MRLNIKSSDAENHTIDYICTICGHINEGTPVNHNFGDWTYDGGSTHKQVCECGWISTESCTDDKYEDKGGYHIVKCLVCKGEIRTEKHSFEAGSCICGQPENNSSSEYDDYYYGPEE